MSDIISKHEQKKDWFYSYNMIFDLDIPYYAKLTYLYLCRCADSQSKSFPSYNNIGEKCGFSRDSAMRAITILEEVGLILKKERKVKAKTTGEKRNTSNLYYVYDRPNKEISEKNIKKNIKNKLENKSKDKSKDATINPQVKQKKIDMSLPEPIENTRVIGKENNQHSSCEQPLPKQEKNKKVVAVSNQGSSCEQPKGLPIEGLPILKDDDKQKDLSSINILDQQINQFVTRYNIVVSKKIVRLTTKRKEKLKVLIDTLGIDRVMGVINVIAKSKWATANIDFSYLIENEDNFVDALEGKYTERASVTTTQNKKNARFTNIASHNWDFDKLEQLEQEYIQKKLHGGV